MKESRELKEQRKAYAKVLARTPRIVGKGMRSLDALGLSVVTKADKQRVFEVEAALYAIDSLSAEFKELVGQLVDDHGAELEPLGSAILALLNESMKMAAKAKELGA
jgi:hypothetical protein